MKHILTLCFLAASLSVFAQKGRRITPAFFISGEVASADSFNRFLLMAVPEYQFKSKDTSDSKKLDYVYTDKKNKLKITYFLEGGTGKKNATKAERPMLSHIEFRGDFPVLARMFNKLTNDTLDVEALRGELPIQGPITYGRNDYVWNKNSYWFTLADFQPKEGFCMLFRKIK
jgi:hypothetical protein